MAPSGKLKGVPAVCGVGVPVLPLEVPGVGTALNRYLVRAPGMQHVSLYRVYVLRDRGDVPAPRQAKLDNAEPDAEFPEQKRGGRA